MRQSIITSLLALPALLLLAPACGSSKPDSNADATEASSTTTTGSTSSDDSVSGASVTADDSVTGDGDDDSEGDGDTDGRVPGEDEVVMIFDETYFHSGARTNEAEVVFPDESYTYSNITGHFQLTCPNGLCDHWDRYATFGILLDPGEEDQVYVELDRYITAYRVGFSWDSDLTYLRPLLTGTQTMSSFIDTWVSEGHEAGDGWLLTASIEFTGGAPTSPEAKAVIPIWPHQSFNYGNPDEPVNEAAAPLEISVPPANYYMLRSFISGHGFGGNENCAEFCAKTHSYSVEASDYPKTIWRDDCNTTVTDGTQLGTWEYARAGWCPGAQVFPWDLDVTDAVDDQGMVTVGYDIEPFVWNGASGQPYYYMSGLVFALD